MRKNAAGETLHFTLYGATESSTGQLIQQVLQNRWKQAGIDVDILNQPARVLFGETLPQRKFDGLAMFGWISAPEHLPLTILKSDQIPTAENHYEGQNYTGYNNPKVDALIDQIELELDFDKRVPLWHELQKIYASDLPALPVNSALAALVVGGPERGFWLFPPVYPTCHHIDWSSLGQQPETDAGKLGAIAGHCPSCRYLCGVKTAILSRLRH
jgi:peptide/nickel transport system substrate-binding protein